MSNENILLHISNSFVRGGEVLRTVLNASEKPIQNSSVELLQLQNAINDQLNKASLPTSEPIGDNCLVIPASEPEVPWILHHITRLALETSALMVLENSRLVWLFGDESIDFITKVSHYGFVFECPCASLSAIPQWINEITQRTTIAPGQPSKIQNQDFLVVKKADRTETFIQTVFDPVIRSYRVEMRLGDEEHHYWRQETTQQAVVQEFITWISSESHSTQGWHKLELPQA